MAEGHVRVNLQVDPSVLSAQLLRARELAPSLRRRLALSEATWEPHDWSESEV